MGSAYEPLGPVDGNIPDAPEVALAPPEPGISQLDRTPASASKLDSGPGVLLDGGLPLRDDGLDFNSHQQSVAGSKEKSKTLTLKNPLKSDATEKSKTAVSKKGIDSKIGKKSKCCSVAMIVIGGIILTSSIALLVVCILLKVM